MKQLDRICFKISKLSLPCIFAFLLLSFSPIYNSSCMNNVNTMVSSYNSNFKELSGPTQDLLPGDNGFDQSTMLNDKYTLSNDATLVLTAPKAVGYYWEIYRVTHEDNGFTIQTNKDLIDLTGRVDFQHQTFSFYCPHLEDLKPGTYELRLEVIDKANRHYRDACTLVIYDPFYEFF